MSLPEIAGHELQDLVGSGSCGAVYVARTPEGQSRAVKVLSSMAINRKALSTALQALQNLPDHPGILAVEDFSFDRSPYFVASPLVGVATKDGDGQRRWETPTLETACHQNMATDMAWRVIYDLAEALAWLHKHGLPHGNLRPTNVLLEDDPDSSIRLTDVAQGWVGGIHHLELSDHFAYLCPNQAENPEGVFAGFGASWDVYSFGVLAYRLLTGRLPRGEGAWNQQLQLSQEQRNAGLAYQIDSLAILEEVRQQPAISWPREATSKWEQRRRDIIERALDLNGAQRWSDMREVLHEFETLESDYLLEESRQQTVDERLKQAKKVRSLNLIAVSLLVTLSLCTLYAFLTWRRAETAESTIDTNLATYQADVDQREARAANEIEIRDTRIGELTDERDTARRAKSVADANLLHSQNAVDRFLTQLLETPTSNELEIEFSRSQMQDALAFCERNLKLLEGNPEMGFERARTYGNLGQIHLRLRDDVQALSHLEKAYDEANALIEDNPDLDRLPYYHQLRGRYGLLLSDLAHRHGDTATSFELLQEATPHLQKGLKADPLNRLARLDCARSYLELGRRSFATGRLEKSRSALAEVSALLDPEVIGEELTSDEAFLVAESVFQDGLLAREMGDLDQALAILIESVQVMGELVMGRSPRKQDQALHLARAYTELAELVGEHFSAQDALDAHMQGVPILLELNRLHPNWSEVKFLLARNDGAIAQLERDVGKTDEAVKRKQDAMEMVNEILADDESNRRYLFLKSKLRGEYAEFLADQGKSKEAVAMVKGAISDLELLLESAPLAEGEALTPERKKAEIQLAQMYGVMGHSSQEAGEKDLAKTSFTHANERWQRLASAGQEDDIVRQGLSWSRDRLEKLK